MSLATTPSTDAPGTPSDTAATAADLRQRFAAELAQGRRARDAALALGVSEGAAVAAHAGAGAAADGAPTARPLRRDWIDLLRALEPCGPLMALTRNEHVVHEKTGVYRNIDGNEQMGLALGGDIDLRFFFARWHAGFAVTGLAANPGNVAEASLQFFDRQGLAIHKIYPRPATDLAAWRAVIDRFEDRDAPPVVFAAPAAATAPRGDAEIARDRLLADWAALQDTHEFFGLLKLHGVAREQALRLAEGRFSRALGRDAIRALLLNAAVDATPIMVFVASGGCTQIHTGPVHRIEPREMRGTTWLNVLDPGFNLHLREDAIARVWVVEKPTRDGTVTSVEAFDAQGELIAMFFGERKPGAVELDAWRRLVAGLPAVADGAAR